MKIFTSLFILLFFTLSSYAQHYNISDGYGEVRFTMEENVQYLLEKTKREHRIKSTAKAYRIQIISNTDRQRVYETKSAFIAKHRQMKADVDYKQPYYKLRTGYFLDRYEAERILRIIKKDFGGAFIVKEDMKIDLLLTELQNQKASWRY